MNRMLHKMALFSPTWLPRRSVADMKRFYNIQTGYSLAQNALDAIYGVEQEIVCLEGFVDYQEPGFSERIGVPRQHTVLHVFLQNLEVMAMESVLYDFTHSESFEFLDWYFRLSGVEPPEWFTEDEIDDHSPELKALFPKLAPIAAESAFEILFNDREFLYEFQLRLKEVIEREDTPHPSDYFDDRGRVKRVLYLPKWLQRAVYYRDRGRCQNCLKDVSGEVYHLDMYHMDHVLPLAEGGTNDPTNFQLLCKACNLKKGGRGSRPTNRQVRFWEMK